MSLQTPLARVRGLGSAKDGTHHWWVQRLTAVALIPLTLWFVFGLAGAITGGYESIIAWIENPMVTVLLICFLAALYYHAVLGVQVVIEDYVDSEWQKIASLIIVKLLGAFAGLTSIFAVLKISLGM